MSFPRDFKGIDRDDADFYTPTLSYLFRPRHILGALRLNHKTTRKTVLVDGGLAVAVVTIAGLLTPPISKTFNFSDFSVLLTLIFGEILLVFAFRWCYHHYSESKAAAKDHPPDGMEIRSADLLVEFATKSVPGLLHYLRRDRGVLLAGMGAKHAVLDQIIIPLRHFTKQFETIGNDIEREKVFKNGGAFFKFSSHVSAVALSMRNFHVQMAKWLPILSGIPNMDLDFGSVFRDLSDKTDGLAEDLRVFDEQLPVGGPKKPISKTLKDERSRFVRKVQEIKELCVAYDRCASKTLQHCHDLVSHL